MKNETKTCMEKGTDVGKWVPCPFGCTRGNTGASRFLEEWQKVFTIPENSVCCSSANKDVQQLVSDPLMALNKVLQ
jgi:hypothetical protein